MHSLTQRFDAVCERLARAVERAGRPAGTVRLVAISKLHTADTVAELARYWVTVSDRAGMPVFGENYAQEALAKKAKVGGTAAGLFHTVAFHRAHPEPKSRDLIGDFGLLHTVDSLKLAQSLQKPGKTGDWNIPQVCMNQLLIRRKYWCR